ncbi:MAG: hypothetical protein OEZ06_32340 [Myxococcales bacterium]|nr:hypothetical protein [Myxococcales bacterium]
MSYLIDSVVRQTTILIAALATSAGHRASLAHVANQVFLDLVRELKQQGVGNKVIADMFGLALRTYHDKVARLSESLTFKGQSLWEAVLSHIESHGPLTRGKIQLRFRLDDQQVVRSVLKDLVDSGLVFRAGVGDASVYRAASADDLATEGRDPQAALVKLLLVAINEHGPLDRAQLLARVPVDATALDAALAQLSQDARVEVQGHGEAARYACREFTIGWSDPDGWEAALFDHYQAMVTAICAKLQRGLTHAEPDDTLGGSTYAFDLWQGHPLQAEVLGLLSRLRTTAVDLRQRVDDYNRSHDAGGAPAIRVTAYVGQSTQREGQSDDD